MTTLLRTAACVARQWRRRSRTVRDLWDTHPIRCQPPRSARVHGPRKIETSACARHLTEQVLSWTKPWTRVLARLTRFPAAVPISRIALLGRTRTPKATCFSAGLFGSAWTPTRNSDPTPPERLADRLTADQQLGARVAPFGSDWSSHRIRDMDHQARDDRHSPRADGAELPTTSRSCLFTGDTDGRTSTRRSAPAVCREEPVRGASSCWVALPGRVYLLLTHLRNLYARLAKRIVCQGASAPRGPDDSP